MFISNLRFHFLLTYFFILNRYRVFFLVFYKFLCSVFLPVRTSMADVIVQVVSVYQTYSRLFRQTYD